MHHLGRWLSRLLNDPKLILWVAKHGGVLHSLFASLIAKALKEGAPSLPMQRLWRLALSGHLHHHSASLYEWRGHFERDGFTPALRLQLRDLLSPRVRLSAPFGSWKVDGQVEASSPPSLKRLVDWEIVLNANYAHSALQHIGQIALCRNALPEMLSDATTLLRDALDLMRELEGADDRHDGSYWHQPSISEHQQNRRFHDWIALIELARDAWLAIAERFPDRARLEAERWFYFPYPLFKRLALFAASHLTVFTPEQALRFLLADDHWWLWSIETRRETLHLLVTLAPRLDTHLHDALQCAVLQGPPPAMFRDDIEPEQLQQTIDHEIWLRLAKCNAAGVHLGAEATARLDALSQQYHSWQLAQDERDEFPFWMDDGGD